MRARRIAGVVAVAGASAVILSLLLPPQARGAEVAYSDPETRKLVRRVDEAAALVSKRGREAFPEFRKAGSKWRDGQSYVFVLDLEGEMVVHPDRSLEGKKELDLKDVQGKLIVRGLLEASLPEEGKKEGWYHYQWAVPGGLLPRWKSSVVRRVRTPSGETLVVGSGMYNDRMERRFVVDAVEEAARRIEAQGLSVLGELGDPKGRFVFKDAYVFVIDPSGVDLLNPAFPNLQGRKILDVTDDAGKKPVREMLELAEKRGSGWVDYLWPKPGHSESTRKSAYVKKVRFGDRWVVVGCGTYLPGAATRRAREPVMSARELEKLVREGAGLLEKNGVSAFAEFRKKPSRWFKGETYFFVWDLEGKRLLHAADPGLEGQSGKDSKDVHGRPYGRMFLDAAGSPLGEGWVHYQYPEPGRIFPEWKSTFIKRVTLPSGERVLIGSGVYRMKLDETLLVDLVDRAARRISEEGEGAFSGLRDASGPFRFMDTYVFVDTPDGVEHVNPAQPSLEGLNISKLKDARGKVVAREYLDLALKRGEGWISYSWYRPGDNAIAKKRTFVRKVRHGDQVFIVGSGIYSEGEGG